MFFEISLKLESIYGCLITKEVVFYAASFVLKNFFQRESLDDRMQYICIN
jgi:hypothetical protein